MLKILFHAYKRIRTAIISRKGQRPSSPSPPSSSVLDTELFLYIYNLQHFEIPRVPRNVTRVRVDPSVPAIGKYAFKDCTQLGDVEVCEGLERIEHFAFENCTSLERITVPSAVKSIGYHAFGGCTQLRDVELHEGLENMDSGVFRGCSSLQQIRIPSSLELICHTEFMDCTSLVKTEFVEEIEQLVDEASLLWWNNGLSTNSLQTYSFLAQRNIPARLNLIKLRVWTNNIHNMLQRIPEQPYDYYFDSINSRLSDYENLQEANTLLELALWKWKMSEQANNNFVINEQVKLQCRYDSLSMVPIIIQNVLSFL